MKRKNSTLWFFGAYGLTIGILLVTDKLKSAIENSVRYVLLSIVHQVVNELRNHLIVENGIRKDHTLFWFCFSHFLLRKFNVLCGLRYLILQRLHRDIYSTFITPTNQNYVINRIKVKVISRYLQAGITLLPLVPVLRITS